MLKHYLYVFFISMVPIVELRGAVPIATAYHAADPSFSLPNRRMDRNACFFFPRHGL